MRIFAALFALVTTSQLFGAPLNTSFGKDERPVDGVKLVLDFKPDVEAGTNITKTINYFDRTRGEYVESKNLLATSAACTYSNQGLRCVKDQRDVDGVLFVLTLVPGAEAKTWDAEVTTSYYDRIQGKYVSNTETIGSGLARLPKR